jgi:hypothetical protein
MTSKAAQAAFLVAHDWIDYAHGPGADDGQPTASELVALPVHARGVRIPADRVDLVREVLSVAELYTSDSAVQDDDRLWFRAYPGKLVARARAWLAADAARPAPKPAPQSAAQRQAAFRARKAELSAFEVRGIFIAPELHEKVKAYARKLAKK